MVKIIGHRGAKGLAPENTLASFKKALEYGVDAIECDVQITADGVFAIHHDPLVKSDKGLKFKIANYSFLELKKHRSDLATLDEILELVEGRSELLVEIKCKVDPSPICKRLIEYQDNGHPVKIVSFDYKTLMAVRKSFPELRLVLNERWSGVRATWRAKRLNTKYLQMNKRYLYRSFVKMMYRRGYKLSPYTVNSPDDIITWGPYLYGVVTDRPDLFVK